MKILGLLFWGYLDTDGVIHIKRYTDDRTIENYERSPFVAGIFDPFYAFDSKHAEEKIKECYQNEIKKLN